MRVCDITREDEVVSAYTIVRHNPGESVVDNALPDGSTVMVFETGRRADEALRNRDWSSLGRLIPYGLRPKDPNRTAGAKKAQATRAAKRAAAEEAAAATASQGDAANGSTPAVAAPAAAAPAAAPATAGKTPVKA